MIRDRFLQGESLANIADESGRDVPSISRELSATLRRVPNGPRLIECLQTEAKAWKDWEQSVIDGAPDDDALSAAKTAISTRRQLLQLDSSPMPISVEPTLEQVFDDLADGLINWASELDVEIEKVQELLVFLRQEQAFLKEIA